MFEEQNCCNCKYEDYSETCEPCSKCRNSMIPYTPEWHNAKFLWESEVIEFNDNVNHPTHYTQGGIECIDAMTAAFGEDAVRHFCICNAFKYIWRSKHKNGSEDLEKAKWYINKYKELTESV